MLLEWKCKIIYFVAEKSIKTFEFWINSYAPSRSPFIIVWFSSARCFIGTWPDCFNVDLATLLSLSEILQTTCPFTKISLVTPYWHTKSGAYLLPTPCVGAAAPIKGGGPSSSSTPQKPFDVGLREHPIGFSIFHTLSTESSNDFENESICGLTGGCLDVTRRRMSVGARSQNSRNHSKVSKAHPLSVGALEPISSSSHRGSGQPCGGVRPEIDQRRSARRNHSKFEWCVFFFFAFC